MNAFMTVPSPSPARRPKRQVGKEAGERLGEKQARVASILLPAPSWGPGWKPSVRGRIHGTHLSMPASTGTQPTAVSGCASLHQDETSLRALSRSALPPSELEGRKDQLVSPLDLGFCCSPFVIHLVTHPPRQELREGKVLIQRVGSHKHKGALFHACLLYTSPSPRDATLSRMPSSA